MNRLTASERNVIDSMFSKPERKPSKYNNVRKNQTGGNPVDEDVNPFGENDKSKLEKKQYERERESEPLIEEDHNFAKLIENINGKSLDTVGRRVEEPTATASTDVVLAVNDSVIESSELNRAITQKTPVNVSGKTVFHLILDCDYAEIGNLAKEEFKREAFGSIRYHLKKADGVIRIPVLDKLTDAQKLAEKLLNLVVTSGTSKGKKFPIFGVIILGIVVGDLTVDEPTQQLGGRRDYNFLSQSSDKDLIWYDINGNKRGLMSKKGLEKSKIYSASYGAKTVTPKEIGFALFNHCNELKLSEKEIQELNNIYNLSTSLNLKSHYVFKPPIDNADPAQLGGDYTRYKNEKKRYLELKQIAKKRGLI
jgi:hypothetical protein